ncbi:uncharacterized protein LOC135461614 [Liolophura sinensis]|uniref:uncharacterized protein LOC135461614 n=1 Tax=Liolophura sinensis TaxID=3198878 RepID=UPI003159113D
MTSMELFPPTGNVHKAEPKEWGTGDFRADAKEKVWIAKHPSWQYSGEASEHKYTLTPLKLSNVRMTDQLLPDPKECTMGPLLINKPFPAEHPYSSHIPRNALIPKFDSPEDPKRGVKARSLPINNEMPACPYDVTIVSKTKGFGYRHELQALPSESEKRPLVWLGEDGFDQLVKTHGGRQSYYPYPPKLVAPNLQDRPVEMKISERTANTLRNVERSQWQTSYDLAHTGLGDANPMSLDNYKEKMEKFKTDGTEDDNLYPRSTNTFVAPRPMEGRIARQLSCLPKPQGKQAETEMPSERKMTLNEIEEDRLLNGKEYINLPITTSEGALTTKQPSECASLSQRNSMVKCYQPQEEEPVNYLDKFKQDQAQRFQQIEAQNRWKVLENQTPKHDIELLNVKYSHVNDGDKPKTFYEHEGKFNEERAGLYKTSFDPYRLYHSMNHLETSGPEIMNTMFSHVDAISVPSDLNAQMRDDLHESVTIPDRSPGEEFSPLTSLAKQKHSQKEWLQPSTKNCRVKVQEGETILTESTKGDCYDVPKFLQEYDLPKYARNDPACLMSNENQNLDNVRLTASLKADLKTVRFADDLRQSLPARPVSRTGQPNTIQYTSRHAQWKRENECHVSNVIVPVPGITDMVRREKTMPCSSAVVRFSNPRPISAQGRPRNEFASLSTNFAPTNLTASVTESTAYSNQFPAYDLRKDEDPRFKWQPGCGKPRPQTTLLKLQESFSKSRVHSTFHQTFHESAPDLRHGIRMGKKHTFDGMNAQTLHG